MNNNIILYSTPCCKRCKEITAKLRFKKINFIESSDIKELLRLKIYQVPALLIPNNKYPENPTIIKDFLLIQKWIDNYSDDRR